MTISQQIEKIREEMCDKYCKFPDQTPPEGKDVDWLWNSDDAPCNNCPLNKL